MINPSINFTLFTLPTFSFALTLALAIGVGIGVIRSRLPAGMVIDCCLGALASGIIGGRIVHVLLNWAYFSARLDEALRPAAGGLDWHGAVIGGVIGLALVARWRKISAGKLLNALAPALPLVALGAWVGCAAAVCGWGAEVDTLAHYPAYAVSESRDIYGIAAPRYNTQLFGASLALGVLVVGIVLTRRGWLEGRRFPLLLALISVGMFGIGFYRGDPAVMRAELRADQWLDAGIFMVSALFLFGGIIRKRHEESSCA